MKTTMYDTLLQLPLFQGLGQNDITYILEKVKLNFSKYKAGERIIEQGDICDKIIFLLKGELVATTSAKENIFSWSEIIDNPVLIEPQSIFGKNTLYISSYSTLSDVDTVSIAKTYILNELNNFEIFRLNYFNILSSQAQSLREKIWELNAQKTEDKIKSFFFIHSTTPKGKKILRIKMEDFAMLLDDTRLNISKALNDMQELGLIELKRKEIIIPELSLLTYYKP